MILVYSVELDPNICLVQYINSKYIIFEISAVPKNKLLEIFTVPGGVGALSMVKSDGNFDVLQEEIKIVMINRVITLFKNLLWLDIR